MSIKMKKTSALIVSAFLVMSVCSGCNENPQNQLQNHSDESELSALQPELPTDIYSQEQIQTIKDSMAQEAEKTDGIIKLTVSSLFYNDIELEETLINEFEELYSDERYTFDISLSGNVNLYSLTRNLLESPENGADVFYNICDDLPELIDANILAEPDTILARKAQSENTADSVDACTFNGKLYAFPENAISSSLLFYDKRVYSEQDIRDTDTIIEVTEGNGTLFCFDLSHYLHHTSFFLGTGVDIRYENGVQTAKLDSDEGVKAVRGMLHLVDQDVLFHLSEGQTGGFWGINQSHNPPALPDWGKGFSAQICYSENAEYIKKKIGKENFGVAKLPTTLIDDEQVQLHSVHTYHILAVNSRSDYPTTAQYLAFYLANADSQLKRYETLNTIPTNKSVLENDTVKSDPIVLAFQEQFPYSHLWARTIGEGYVNNNTSDFGLELYNRRDTMTDETIKSRLAQIQKQMESNTG